MKKRYLKRENGLAGTDAIIAVLIITLFTGLIASISYNIFLSNSSIKRMSRANSFIIDAFEYVDRSYYDDVTKESLEVFFNEDSKYNNEAIALAYIEGEVPNKTEEDYKDELNKDTNHRYKILIKIDKYNKDLDLVEEITVTVFYKLNGRNQEITMKHTKSRESLKTPNAPNLNSLNVEEGFNKYPVKKINDTLIVCDRNDTTWYDYKYGSWAFAIEVEQELNIGDEIDINDLEENDKLYAWIPRFAINDEDDIIFIFSVSDDKYIDNTEVKTIDKEYEIPEVFTIDENNNEKNYTGIWVEYEDGMELKDLSE